MLLSSQNWNWAAGDASMIHAKSSGLTGCHKGAEQARSYMRADFVRFPKP